MVFYSNVWLYVYHPYIDDFAMALFQAHPAMPASEIKCTPTTPRNFPAISGLARASSRELGLARGGSAGGSSDQRRPAIRGDSRKCARKQGDERRRRLRAWLRRSGGDGESVSMSASSVGFSSVFSWSPAALADASGCGPIRSRVWCACSAAAQWHTSSAGTPCALSSFLYIIYIISSSLSSGQLSASASSLCSDFPSNLSAGEPDRSNSFFFIINRFARCRRS